MRLVGCSKWVLLAAALLAGGSSFAGPQSAPASDATQPDQSAIHISSDLVDLPVSVTDHKGNFVEHLTQQDFHVLEDGKPQTIALFEPQDLPVTVGLVVDHSGSMRSKLPEVSAAGAAFAKSSNPQDHLFVVNFNEIVSLMLPASVSFTSDPEELEKAIGGASAHGETALYDAVIDALKHLDESKQQRQALILVTDGGDNASRHTFGQVLAAAMKSKALIYCVAIYDPSDEDAKPRELIKLGKVTGGEAYFPENATDVTNIIQQIAQTLRKEYMVGFVPPEQGPRSWRTIRVEVSAPGKHRLSVRTRSGYLFPGGEPTADVEKAEN